MPYDRDSFLAGIAAGRNSAGWPLATENNGAISVILTQSGSFLAYGNGTIDWGDETETAIDGEYVTRYSHQYPAGSGRHLVRVFGNIRGIAFYPSDPLFGTNYSLAEVLSPIPKTVKVGNLVSFGGCVNLHSVPEDLFKHQTEAYACHSFHRAGLTDIPEKLFWHNTKLETFSEVFQRNLNLASIPGALFSRNAMVMSFAQAFEECTSLEEIPAELFRGNPLAKSFSKTFRNCTALSDIPADLFSGNPAVESFDYTFYGCSGITGNVPPLWETHPTASHKSCFFGCTNAANYADIPLDWRRYTVES